jgi:hypothetical protein
MDLWGVWLEGMDQTHLAEDRVWWWAIANMVVNHQVV